jgi:hypothetical protein
VVSPAPFSQWVQQALKSNNVNIEPGGKIGFYASRNKCLLPKDSGKVFESYCIEVQIFGIEDKQIIGDIVAAVQCKSQDQLRHHGLILFYDNEHSRKLIHKEHYTPQKMNPRANQ